MSFVNQQASLEGHHLIGRGNQATNIGFDHLFGYIYIYNGDIEKNVIVVVVVVVVVTNDDLIAG